ncbi:FGGY-family carbohydrate kinase [Anaerotignum sp.]
MAYYLGIDIGTRESKGVLIDEDGRICWQAAVGHGLAHPRPGWFSQDAERIWWGDFCRLCRILIEQAAIFPAEIGCVGLSALGCDCVPIGKDGKALSDAILYGIDSRAEKEIQWALEKYGKNAEKIFGHMPCSSDVAPKVLWFRNHHKDIWESAYKFLTASSYLCGRLTDRYVLDPYLAEDFLPLYDLKNGRIHAEGCEDFCRPDQMAELLPATAIAGHVTERAAKETGLAAGTPVLTGTGDSGAEAISAGVCQPGDMMIQLGSTGYLIYLSDRMIDEPRLWPGTFILPDTYGICAGTNTAGALTQWMKEQWYRETETGEAFSKMAEEAAKVPAGSEGLLCLPYFAGERTPINDPKARGCFLGLETGHTRGHLVRAGLEGICYSMQSNLELLKSHGLQVKRIFAVGGGTKNAVWMQCLADILEQEISVPKITVGAAYGDALMAALAGGAFQDWAELSGKIQVEKKYVPNPETFAVYRKQGILFATLYEKTKEMMHLLSENKKES